jgi:hypothetical protein
MGVTGCVMCLFLCHFAVISVHVTCVPEVHGFNSKSETSEVPY